MKKPAKRKSERPSKEIEPGRLLFSVSGARGIVGESLDTDIVKRLVLAFASILPAGPIVMGRDTRPSGEALMQAAIGAVTATGHDCIDLGIAATPTVEMVVERHKAAGGVIVTASHNPIEWNALKFLDRRGIFIEKEAGDELFNAFQADRFVLAGESSKGKVRSYSNAARDHIEAILSLDIIDASRIRDRRFTVVLDCINGAGSVIAPDLLDALGARVIKLDCELDGNFHRDPEPRPENLSVLANRVKEEQADIGFAADPDADRLALVDNLGNAISEEYTLALGVDLVLANNPGPVVVNVSTSSIIDRIAESHGVQVSRTPVGEAHVVAKMLDCHAVIGGEGNGGIIYPELHPGRDAMLSMALILQLLTERKTSLRDQIDRYPPFVMHKEKAPKTGDFSAKKISRLIQGLKPDKIDTRDGVKALFSEGWFHLRLSNTEGIVRIISEAATEDKVQDLIKAARRILKESFN
ncbi:MAG: phosphoglucosamine mutase [Candidatus Latescibacteria bacterium]|nr:phosphoglucosamine mutase [Candidatus Latescibacterota bacterium]NIM22184.1 phosphoglucosamine mutase [Candidatus Latescibacterota bacterium]NIM64734.1 phosphoglucosamine mutase [Candidatus Latescibacterota bacterium]NIO01244.1 phosphoglucosamine mutase [Candidatus Latescibacterota bacterium]NIO27629.1 phosphoglucosamine mutase [Candidatus Latescibacterota bacterium]